jgi:hypothetical protein
MSVDGESVNYYQGSEGYTDQSKGRTTEYEEMHEDFGNIMPGAVAFPQTNENQANAVDPSITNQPIALPITHDFETGTDFGNIEPEPSELLSTSASTSAASNNNENLSYESVQINGLKLQIVQLEDRFNELSCDHEVLGQREIVLSEENKSLRRQLKNSTNDNERLLHQVEKLEGLLRQTAKVDVLNAMKLGLAHFKLTLFHTMSTWYSDAELQLFIFDKIKCLGNALGVSFDDVQDFNPSLRFTLERSRLIDQIKIKKGEIMAIFYAFSFDGFSLHTSLQVYLKDPTNVTIITAFVELATPFILEYDYFKSNGAHLFLKDDIVEKLDRIQSVFEGGLTAFQTGVVIANAELIKETLGLFGNMDSIERLVK